MTAPLPRKPVLKQKGITKKSASVSFETPSTQQAKAEMRNTHPPVKKEPSQSTPVSVKREARQLTPENLKSLVTKVLGNADSTILSS